MSLVRIRGALCLIAAAAVITACGSSGTEPGGTSSGNAAAIAKVSGEGQTGLIGTQLSTPLTVKVTTSAGAAVKGALVNFAVASGAASVTPTSATTDSSGVAKTSVKLGTTAGAVQITASVAGTSLSTTFSVTAGSGTITTACTGTTPQAPTLGSVNAGMPGTGVCLSGGTAGADYALIAFNANPDSNFVSTSFTVQSSGATALSTPDVATFNVAQKAPLMSPLRAGTPNDVRSAFDRRLRETALRELTPKIGAARSAYRHNASFSTIPQTLTIGQTITLNANGQQACSNAINVRARVAAISNTAIIVADSTNPAGGFTDDEYASFATTFDTLVNPLDVQNFGSPSDMDKNGKIVILFTKEVNKLTPRGSSGFIGGFFFERDLFPKVSTADLDGCGSSNEGEMFYLLVPDSGAVYSDRRTKSDVLSNTIGTLAHEYQHLINAGRRLYINTDATAFETVWLNEGLSHIAEELLYLHVAGLAPRQNIGISQITANGQTSIDNFNNYQSDNIGRYELFLEKTSKTNVYGANDSLETRGATWNLLRYLADHRGTNDGDVWKLLVDSKYTDHKNLETVFGGDYMTQIRNWAVSVFTDDLPSVSDARFQEPTWNMRNIFPQLCANSSCSTRLGKLPLQITPLGDGSPANVSLFAGGAVYLRFTVPAGGQASIDWSAGGLPVSSFVNFTLVRTR
jgi:hypothetical protein